MDDKTMTFEEWKAGADLHGGGYTKAQVEDIASVAWNYQQRTIDELRRQLAEMTEGYYKWKAAASNHTFLAFYNQQLRDRIALLEDVLRCAEHFAAAAGTVNEQALQRAIDAAKKISQ